MEIDVTYVAITFPGWQWRLFPLLSKHLVFVSQSIFMINFFYSKLVCASTSIASKPHVFNSCVLKCRRDAHQELKSLASHRRFPGRAIPLSLKPSKHRLIKLKWKYSKIRLNNSVRRSLKLSTKFSIIDRREWNRRKILHCQRPTTVFNAYLSTVCRHLRGWSGIVNRTTVENKLKQMLNYWFSAFIIR